MRAKIFTLFLLLGITMSCVDPSTQNLPPAEYKAAPEECPEACLAIEKAKCDLTGTDETCLQFCTRMETGSIGTYVNPKCQKTIKTCSDMDKCMANNSKPAAAISVTPGVVNPKLKKK